MKKIKISCLTLSVLTLFAMAACGGGDVGVIGGDDGPTVVITDDPGTGAEPAPEGTAQPAGAQTAADAAYAFVSGGVSLTPDAEAAPLTTALGEPLSYFEAESCAFEGLDKIYTYGGFEVDTYPDENGVDRISAVILKDDSVATPEGLMIGDAADRITETYGEPTSAEGDHYVYEKGGSALRFILQGGGIISIEYVSLTAA